MQSRPENLPEEARLRDRDDPLSSFKSHFYGLEGGAIYLDGNSLGLLSREAEAAALQALDQWKRLGVEGWSEASPAWFTLPEQIAAQVAPLVGASENEVIVTGSTTVNLHQLLATLYDPTNAERPKILADALAFPSDIFAIESHLRLRGLDPERHLVKVPSRDGFLLTEDDILAAMTPDVQMAVLPAVVYTSGQLLPLQRITAEARRRGILIGWDCSHSIGAVPHSFDDWDIDFAFWCHYKYLNAGPGAVGGLYLNRRHFGKAPGLAGWFSSRKERQFDMTHTLSPADGAGGLQIGTPHILSLAPLSGSLTLHEYAGMDRLRTKSLALTDFLRQAIIQELSAFGVTIVTPAHDDQRGGHLALVHPEAAQISRALRKAGVIPDFRPPNIVRLAPVPLYTSFADCWEAVSRLRRILENDTYREMNEGSSLVP
ncbi:MAG: kynureninase [Armatimonadota bacterium]